MYFRSMIPGIPAQADIKSGITRGFALIFGVYFGESVLDGAVEVQSRHFGYVQDRSSVGYPNRGNRDDTATGKAFGAFQKTFGRFDTYDESAARPVGAVFFCDVRQCVDLAIPSRKT